MPPPPPPAPPPPATGPFDWQPAVDPASKRTYYFSPSTNQTTWDMPLGLQALPVSGASPVIEPLFQGNAIHQAQTARVSEVVQITGWDGSYIDGLPMLMGTAQYSDGSVYVGRMYRGIRAGGGKLTKQNGDYYAGEWINNKKHGWGTLVEGGKVVHHGVWTDDKPRTNVGCLEMMRLRGACYWCYCECNPLDDSNDTSYSTNAR
jgi:hypothetical protein